MPAPSAASISSRHCPQCRHSLLRVRRQAADRSDHPGLHRYRCGALVCGWEGLLPRRSLIGHPRRRAGDSGRTGRTARTKHGSWLARLALAFTSLAAMAGLPLLLLLAIGLGPAWLLGPGAGLKDWRSLPIGQSDGGVLIEPTLADLQVAGTTPRLQAKPSAGSAQAPPARGSLPQHLGLAAVGGGSGTPMAAAAAPLELRHGCAWGQPGRSPYKGTTEQALAAAGLPAEVVQRVSMMRTAGAVTDRLQISRHQIRSLAGEREFDPQSFVMTFGHTICRSSRVNFALGHVEAADLYEVRDNKGRRHAVMGPDVCGNVSVLGNRAERGPASKLAQALAERGLSTGWLDAVLEDGVLTTAQAIPVGPFTVPEPGTLAAVLLALGLLWRMRRRQAGPGG